MEERQAIARLQKGDLSGLEALVTAYQAQAVQAACLIVQDRALAEEIVQNAFIIVAERIAQYDPERPFRPWFLRSVVNAAIKSANSQKRQVFLNEQLPGQDFSLADILADSGPLPEEWLEQEEKRASVLQAIEQLPAEQRAVIVMRYFLEVSEDEMAGELQRPKSTIKYWLRAARKQLKQLLPSRHGTQSPAVPEKEVWHE